MEKQDILKTINNILCDIFNDPTLVITEATSAQNIERWDSITHVNILMTVERTFKIRFSLGEIKQLRNVGEMINLVSQKLPS
jgi:acyl carrier protein